MGKLQHAKAILGSANWYYSTFSFDLRKDFQFKDFREAWDFLRLLAFQKDVLPPNYLNYEYSNLYNKVSFRVPINDLTTAQLIDNIYNQSKNCEIRFRKDFNHDS